MRSLRLAVIGAILTLGCSSPSIPEAPEASYDANSIVQAAMQELDKNKNGSIEINEADASPALKFSFLSIDQNNDKKISADELKQRIESYSGNGNVLVSCEVLLDEKPLADATVTFEPERWMGKLKPATCKTDSEGMSTEFQIDGKKFTSLAAGFYQIRVTKDGTSIPAKFNSKTILGREVVVEPRQPEIVLKLQLTSR